MTPITRAALWMTGAISSFSIMAVAGREVSTSLDTFEIMLYRSLLGVVVVLSAASFFGTLNQINRQQFGTHVVRNVAHFTGQNLWFFAVTVAPLAQVFALEFTSPIWVIVLAPLVLGEKLTRIRVLAAILGFSGILIVARPTVAGLTPGTITAAASAIFFAITVLTTKRLTRTQTMTCIMFYLTAIQLVLGLVAAGYDRDIALPDAGNLHWVILIGVAGLAAHFCIVRALSIAPAVVVMPMDFIRLPVIAVIGMLVYREQPDLLVFLGAAVIFAGNYLNIWHETRRKPDPVAGLEKL